MNANVFTLRQERQANQQEIDWQRPITIFSPTGKEIAIVTGNLCSCGGLLLEDELDMPCLHLIAVKATRR